MILLYFKLNNAVVDCTVEHINFAR